MMRKRPALFLMSFVLLIILAGLIGPYFKEPFEARYSSSTLVYDRYGTLLRFTLTNDQKYRLWVPLAEISEPVKTSFLQSEDRYFFKHPGINPWSILRSGWTTYFLKGRRTGASTISMQLARMVNEIDSKKPWGKLRQIYHAFKIELLYSKEEILEAYLNLVPMGGNIEGVAAASRIFFKTKISEVKWPEAVILAVIPQNPNKRTLLKGFDQNIIPARDRLAEKIKHLAPPIEQRLLYLDAVPSHIHDLPFSAPHFVNNVLDRTPGRSVIKTTLDQKVQKLMEEKVSGYLKTKNKSGIHNASAVLINWQTSEVVSWVGSADFFNSAIMGQVDGVKALRSPGSTLKPFIYALAMDEGLIHPGTILKDSPKSFGSYDPENFDGEFRGPLSAEDALNQSRNLPAVELVTKLKDKNFYQFLLDAGVGIPKNQEYYGHSIALGGFELSLLELAELYAVLPRRGLLEKMRFTQEETGKKKSLKRVLSQESAYLVLDVLSRARIDSPLYHRLSKKNEIKVSWKTGTSSGFRDAWTLGAFGPYVLGVWVGDFAGRSNRSLIGREMAAPLFFELMDTIRWQTGIDQQSILSWIKPQGVKLVHVCPISGKLPGPYCQHKKEVGFIPGTSPIDHCDIHRQIWVSKKDGTLSCKPHPAKDKAIVHEFWPTDLLDIFAKAGFPRKQPPRPGNSCRGVALSTIGATGSLPEILSPKEEVVYNLRSQATEKNAIPFEASIDSSASELYWFIDDEFIGTTTLRNALFWKARAGRFVVKAIDNLGRSSSRKIQVKYAD